MKDLLNFEEDFEAVPEMEKHLGNNIGATFSKVIFALRVQKGLTQEKLAKISGVGAKTIYRAEGGSYNLGIDNYNKILNGLGVPLTEFVDLLKAAAEEQQKKTFSYNK